jgi:hypothetical protein
VQNRASEHIPQAVLWAVKKETAFGVIASKSATLVSEIAKKSFMVNIEYSISPRTSLRQRK